MKIAVQKILSVGIVFLIGQFAIGAEIQTPPPPTPPPGLPIDGGVVIMFFIALILGYIISKRNIFTNKSSL